jgi:hypothetical protein
MLFRRSSLGRASFEYCIGAILALTVALFGAAAAAMSGSGSVRDYLYRRISYQVLAGKIAGDERTPEQVAARMVEYVWESEYPGGGVVRDDTVLTSLVRGIGWCDQDVWALGTLLEPYGIPVRLLFLKDETGASPHSMGEILLDGKWRVVDPLLGMLFRNHDGSLATFDDLSNNPAVIEEQLAVRALPAATRQRVVGLFARLFPVRGVPERWVVEQRTWSKRAVDSAIRLALATLGARRADTFQDWFLARLDAVPALDSATGHRSRVQDPALFLYYRARNYHLYGRTDLARRSYDELLTRYPASPYAEPARFFEGLLKLELQHDGAGAIGLLRDAIRHNARSAWAVRARYVLGETYEETGHIRRATRYYRVASADPYVPAAAHLILLRAQSNRSPGL